MSIHYLNANDFSQEGGHLAANIGGITFVMFHSQQCSYCPKFIPEFTQLPHAIRGINFGLCSVDGANRIIVQLSQNSSTPIKSVPKFILYNDGIPYIEYNGQRNRQAILKFLQEIISKLNQKQVFTRPRRSRQAQEMPMPTPVEPQPSGSEGPTRPGGVMGGTGQDKGTANQPYRITPTTGVKEYDTSYGRPYNTLNESDFLEYENAYKQQMNAGKN